MGAKSHATDTDASNWTSATGTKRGARHVHSGNTNTAIPQVLSVQAER